MKVCSQCGAVYEARVEFCFKDGNPLQAAPVAAGVADSGVGSGVLPESLPADPLAPPDAQSSGVASIEDAPEPRSLPVTRSLSDVFDVPEPRFAPLRGVGTQGGGGNTKSKSSEAPMMCL